MKLNEWLMRFLTLDGTVAESVAIAIASIIRKDEKSLKRLYEKLGGDDKMDA